MSVVRELSPEIKAERVKRVGWKPREGRPVRMDRIDGVWSVWAAGPESGTWWLIPSDTVASEVYEQLRANPEGAVVKSVLGGGIAVRTQEIKPFS